ncbi:iron-sulfur cluster co-chaperone protein HscB mitochondrial [Biomphalaria pfeifferi]|uniref:Iron-sulfur cluster co-chaperone protein HscB mitochondrial n=1 Tax=Biomphalaria pfeifferi TaxID=112525 RepID=A0AAD8BN00_BIOPF|nr:iron-sulfur cluster co-chaperone protein HscB mitochondrial [Biomphalaria pfeifferi]
MLRSLSICQKAQKRLFCISSAQSVEGNNRKLKDATLKLESHFLCGHRELDLVSKAFRKSFYSSRTRSNKSYCFTLNRASPAFSVNIIREIQCGSQLGNGSSHNDKPVHNHRSCWNCGRNTSPVLELFFCDCGVVQKPAIELTYFDIMLLEPSFDIDIKKLSDVFKETQKKLHPDKFSAKSETERKLAQEQSSLLNKAYGVLLKPLSRALYLLELQGIPIEDDTKLTDSEFLMEIMEINEKISSIASESDLNSVEADNSSQIENCLVQLSHSFSLKDYSKAKVMTIRLRYYTTIQERLFELRRSRLG